MYMGRLVSLHSGSRLDCQTLGPTFDDCHRSGYTRAYVGQLFHRILCHKRTSPHLLYCLPYLLGTYFIDKDSVSTRSEYPIGNLITITLFPAMIVILTFEFVHLMVIK